MIAGRKPLRVAVLTSSRAPGLRHLLDHPRRGELFEIVVGVVTDPAGEAATELGQLAAVHNLRVFCRDRGGKVGDLELRRQFDERTVQLLRRLRPDLVILSGYLHILTAPMLEAYPGRIVNLHDADLTIIGTDGLPKYRGLHSTYDAIVAGEPETRTTLHLVTGDLDGGPVLFRSRAFPVHELAADGRLWGATRMLKAYAFAQREWMMRSWGRLLARAIRQFAAASATPGPERALDHQEVKPRVPNPGERVARKLDDLGWPELAGLVRAETRHHAGERRMLRGLAFTDVLTGLPNRRAFEHHLKRLGQADPGTEYTVFDLQALHEYNNAYGQAAGDALLRKVADALVASALGVGADPRDLYRVGGDEFVALLRKGLGGRLADQAVALVGECVAGDTGRRTRLLSFTAPTLEGATEGLRIVKGARPPEEGRRVEPSVTVEAGR